MRGFSRELGELRVLFAPKDQRNLIYLFALMLLGATLEAVAVGSVPAFVAFVMKPSALEHVRWVGGWFTGLPDRISLQLLLWASLALLGFVIFKTLFLIFVYSVQFRIVNAQRVRLGDRLFHAYQSAPYEWHLQRGSSDLIRGIQNDTAQVLGNVLLPFLNLMMAGLMSGVIIAMLLIATPSVTLYALLLTGFGLFFSVRVFQKKLRNIGQVNWAEHKEMLQAIQQGFGGLVDARIIGCEAFLYQRHHESLQRLAKAQLQQQLIQKSTPYTLEVFAVLGLLVILLLLVKSTPDLGSLLPLVALLGVVMVRLKQFSSQIAGAINQINVGRPFIPAIVEDFRELDRLERERKARESDSELIHGFVHLELDNVTYRYPGSESPAVENVSLDIRAGESVAFVGPTGCGKSTLISLILGLLEPQTGLIKVNGIDIRHDPLGWRRKLGYVSQAIFLLDDTIQANVAFGVPDDEVDAERLWNVLEAAHIAEFVRGQPRGLLTLTGERGVRLSGGQRQRLGIARALYQEPSVLIMDEATSALDDLTEARVMEAIGENRVSSRTLLLIAHRLTTAESCDRVIFMQDGKVRDRGTFDELLVRSPDFRQFASRHTRDLTSV